MPPSQFWQMFSAGTGFLVVVVMLGKIIFQMGVLVKSSEMNQRVVRQQGRLLSHHKQQITQLALASADHARASGATDVIIKRFGEVLLIREPIETDEETPT